MTEILTIEGGQKDVLLRRANIKKTSLSSCSREEEKTVGQNVLFLRWGFSHQFALRLMFKSVVLVLTGW